jgi:hypothetical protein
MSKEKELEDNGKRYTIVGIDEEGNALHVDKIFKTLDDAKLYAMSVHNISYNINPQYLQRQAPQSPRPENK